jgi:hypothetical protein
MTSPANDTSELTAYAVGELQAHQAVDIHRLLSQCPAALTELEQIEAVTDALRQHAPIPQERLNPEQRHAVLRPVNLPRRMAAMQPRQPIARRPHRSVWPLVGTVLRLAALIAITGFAYWFGRHVEIASLANTGLISANTAAGSSLEKTTQSEKIGVSMIASPSEESGLAVKEIESNPKETVVEPMPVLRKVSEVVSVEVGSRKVEAAPEKPKVAAKALAVANAAPESPAMLGSNTPRVPVEKSTVNSALLKLSPDLAFISAMKKEVDEVAIRPADILPVPVKRDAKQVFASPMYSGAKVTQENAFRRSPSEIYIHAWRAEVASCPWNPSTRLLRISIQMPPSQAAADPGSSYPLQVSFDRRLVREFRRLGIRQLPALEMNSAGTQTLWYEFMPVGDEAIRSNRAFATVSLDKGRFTVSSPGPFSDGAKLAVLDRGLIWTAARDDFLYEAALIGMGTLFRGDSHTPGLNVQTILSMAEKSRANDPTGERAKLVRQLHELKKTAGL